MLYDVVGCLMFDKFFGKWWFFVWQIGNIGFQFIVLKWVVIGKVLVYFCGGVMIVGLVVCFVRYLICQLCLKGMWVLCVGDLFGQVVWWCECEINFNQGWLVKKGFQCFFGFDLCGDICGMCVVVVCYVQLY